MEVNENNSGENQGNTEETKFFSVSLSKLAIMSVCTMGLYELYWFYKNWIHIKNQQQSNIMPFWRAFFAPLWAYSAFKHIQGKVDEEKLGLSLNPVIFAIAYFVVTALWRLPDPLWLLSFLSFLLMVPANNATTKINEKQIENFQQNSSIKGWNWLAIVLGGALFILSLIGTFLPEQA